MSKLFSVIIPTYNRNDLLALCLDCLKPEMQTIDSALYEVIVTDDGRNTTAQQLIEGKYPWARWVKGPQKGPAANRNNGAKHAIGDWLVFTDDDCLPKEDWLAHYLAAINTNPDCKAFEGAIHPDNEDLLKIEFSECPINTTGGCFWSANIAVKNELFNQVKGFDEGYFLAAQEDQQFKIDVERITTIHFLPKCVIIHPVRFTSLWISLKRINKQSKNFGRYAAKNKHILGYDSIMSFYLEQFMFHLRTLLVNLKVFKMRQVVLSFVWLLVGVQINVMYFLKFQK